VGLSAVLIYDNSSEVFCGLSSAFLSCATDTYSGDVSFTGG
jgi:hypothetical protein